jgi:hypothetical protein
VAHTSIHQHLNFVDGLPKAIGVEAHVVGAEWLDAGHCVVDLGDVLQQARLD